MTPALRWVNRNIEGFGGDKKQVRISCFVLNRTIKYEPGQSFF